MEITETSYNELLKQIDDLQAENEWLKQDVADFECLLTDVTTEKNSYKEKYESVRKAMRELTICNNEDIANKREQNSRLKDRISELEEQLRKFKAENRKIDCYILAYEAVFDELADWRDDDGVPYKFSEWEYPRTLTFQEFARKIYDEYLELKKIRGEKYGNDNKD